MTISRKWLYVFYAIVAFIALIGTGFNNLFYYKFGPMAGTLQFWKDSLSTPVSRSLTVDIFFLGLAVSMWMLLEARKLNIKQVWLYIIFGLLIAISFTVPLFMIHREMKLAKIERSGKSGDLSWKDVIGILLLTVAFTGYTVLTFFR